MFFHQKAAQNKTMYKKDTQNPNKNPKYIKEMRDINVHKYNCSLYLFILFLLPLVDDHDHRMGFGSYTDIKLNLLQK